MELENILLIIFLVCLAICGLIMIIAYATKGSRPPVILSNEQLFDYLIRSEDEPIKGALEKLKQLYNNNEALSDNEIISKIGVSKDIIWDSGNYKNPDAFVLSFEYLNKIEDRYKTQNHTLYEISEGNLSNDILLKSNENVYLQLAGVAYYQEKVVRRDVTYSGVRWAANSLRAGNISYTTNSVNGFVGQEYGNLYITNKRIIFIGDKYNKSINFSSIVTYNLFKDGVIISIANTNSVMFKFTEFECWKKDPQEDGYLILLSDDLNRFTGTITRVLNKTQDEDIAEPQTSEEEDSNQSLSIEDLAIKAKEFISMGVPCTGAALQRKLGIGFNKSNQLVEYLLQNPDVIDEVDNESLSDVSEDEIYNEFMKNNESMAAQFEYGNHIRILEDSVSLIENTNHILTLIGRYNDVIEHYNWIANQLEKGIDIPSLPDDFIDEINFSTNENIVRVAKYQYAKYNDDIGNQKTDKSRVKKTTTMFETLKAGIENLKETSNYDESLEVLNEIHFNIENTFSEISK